MSKIAIFVFIGVISSISTPKYDEKERVREKEEEREEREREKRRGSTCRKISKRLREKMF
jgi:hypothetical protein